MNRMIDICYKRRRWLLGVAVFVSLAAVGFSFRNGAIKLWWEEWPLIPVSLLVFALLSLFLYVQLVQWQMLRLRRQIVQSPVSVLAERLAHLTPRQRLVYDLIMAGKTNKEIMAEMYIELSTLKTHINQLYKKLAVKSRSELKRLG